MLEQLSNLFYDPWVFWGLPLVLAVVPVVLRRARRRPRRER
jgi:cytochrome c-type biogenesis protein CcmH/NrfF